MHHWRMGHEKEGFRKAICSLQHAFVLGTSEVSVSVLECETRKPSSAVLYFKDSRISFFLLL